MAWKYTDDYYKNYTRETWNECAERYSPLATQLGQFHKPLIDLVKPSPGNTVLDVCTGLGEPAMSIATNIAPTGHVTGIDLSANMTKIATRCAAERGLKNIRFLTMDAEKLNFPSNNFDVTISCFGFQIVTNPGAAAKEILRVLKPKGRAGFTVWSTGDRTPALDVLVGPLMEHATPDEDGYLPTPYELGGPHELTNMLKESGFSNPTEVRISGNWAADSVDDYLAMLLDGSPLGHSLSEESEDVQEEVREKSKRNISKYSTERGVVIPAECVIVTASKPP
ncbi:MAG TPA: class I SAM-dependent methyltransferase [Candidatus Acidoferrales bacterium]|nr:class I SAM-dependent methyltransferase [Candidatus Acidoferrales bacterium]